MNLIEAKRRAAQEAVSLLPPSGVLGLGTGSTAQLFIEALGTLPQEQRATWRCVPTSEASRQLAAAAGLRLLDDDGPWSIDVCVDGADEVSSTLDLIKGGGGSHTREKIVSQASKRNVIIIDGSKLSDKLGEKHAVPVEILHFGCQSTVANLQGFGQVTLRMRNGAPWLTDSGNLLYDVSTGPIDAPRDLEQALSLIPGVVEVGLFCGRADVVIVAEEAAVRQLRR